MCLSPSPRRFSDRLLGRATAPGGDEQSRGADPKQSERCGLGGGGGASEHVELSHDTVLAGEAGVAGLGDRLIEDLSRALKEAQRAMK